MKGNFDDCSKMLIKKSELKIEFSGSDIFENYGTNG